MLFYRTKRKKYTQGYGFLSFARNLSNVIWKTLLDTATWLDALKTNSKKVFHKTAEATGEFIGNKISDKIVKPKLVTDENLRNADEYLFHLKK